MTMAMTDARTELDPSRTEMARAVREGLSRAKKSLPAWLFYDAEGSRLFELITDLPEYYLTRAERSIFEAHADDIVARALAGTPRPATLSVMELGAGTATKSQILLEAAVRELGRCLFAPVDVSPAALSLAHDRLRREAPLVAVRPIVGDHRLGCAELAKMARRRLVLFIGSSMGNFDDAENVALFSRVRASLDRGDALLVGADRRKSAAELVPAYDDAAGVTAAFNKNVLVRLNRELGADFDPSAFLHVARWNDEASRIEMHLESRSEQRVRIGALDASFRFARGETIHTESSVKYADDRVAGILRAAGFAVEHTFSDDAGRFGVHVARATGAAPDHL